MDNDDELLIRGLNRQEIINTVAKKLTDIGDNLERKARKRKDLSYGNWACFFTALLTMSVYFLPLTDPDKL